MLNSAVESRNGTNVPTQRTGRLLVIEDNPKLAELIQNALTAERFQVEVCYSGREGEEAAVAGEFDAIILDLMLPDHDGVQLCRNLRRRGIATPVLMLTALSTTNDKVAGLEAGSDDYLTKPFELDELTARTRALLRRANKAARVCLQFADIEMDLLKRTVKRGDKKIELTAREFALLEYFMRNPNRVLTRTNIGERVWDYFFEDDSNVVEVYISRLRRKMDRGFDRPLIHTVTGTGYVMALEHPGAALC
jgi:DNA-binding response OmpR family regulator